MFGFSFTRFMAILKKEVIQIRRDRASVIMAIGMPVMMLLLFGYAINTDVDHLPTVVWDQTKTADSREIITNLQNSTYLNFDYYVESYTDVTAYMDSGKARVALIIPADYGKQIQGGGQGVLQVLVDGSDPTAARAANSAIQMVALNRGIEIQSERLNQAGGGSVVGGLPLQVETRVWYNPDMKSLVFNIPGLIGLILQNVTTMLTAFSMVREKERGTMEQLVVTPIKSPELILGKLIPYVFIGFISLTIIMVVGIYWFGVPPKGSIPLLILLTTLFIVTVLSIGLLISTVAKTQLQAMQMTFLLILPGILLSGFMFPRETMPLVIKWIGGAFPVTYYLTIVRGIFLKGVGLEYLWQDTLILTGFALLLFLLAVKKFKKNLD